MQDSIEAGHIHCPVNCSLVVADEGWTPEDRDRLIDEGASVQQRLKCSGVCDDVSAIFSVQNHHILDRL